MSRPSKNAPLAPVETAPLCGVFASVESGPPWEGGFSLSRARRARRSGDGRHACPLSVSSWSSLAVLSACFIPAERLPRLAVELGRDLVQLLMVVSRGSNAFRRLAGRMRSPVSRRRRRWRSSTSPPNPTSTAHWSTSSRPCGSSRRRPTCSSLGRLAWARRCSRSRSASKPSRPATACTTQPPPTSSPARRAPPTKDGGRTQCGSGPDHRS